MREMGVRVEVLRLGALNCGLTNVDVDLDDMCGDMISLWAAGIGIFSCSLSSTSSCSSSEEAGPPS
jgi:hypothetical protein